MAVLVRGWSWDGDEEARTGDLLFRLIQTSDAEAAYARALELGGTCGESLTDELGQKMTAEFLGLADLVQIPGDELSDGVEVYSQLLEGRSLAAERVLPKERLSVFPFTPPPEGDTELEQPIFGKARTERRSEDGDQPIFGRAGDRDADESGEEEDR